MNFIFTNKYNPDKKVYVSKRVIDRMISQFNFKQEDIYPFLENAISDGEYIHMDNKTTIVYKGLIFVMVITALSKTANGRYNNNIVHVNEV